MQALGMINDSLRAAAVDNRWLHYVDCNKPFINATGKSLDATLMPDALHPSVGGAHLLASCIAAEVEKHMPASRR